MRCPPESSCPLRIAARQQLEPGTAGGGRRNGAPTGISRHSCVRRPSFGAGKPGRDQPATFSVTGTRVVTCASPLSSYTVVTARAW